MLDVPEDANVGCPGTESKDAGKGSSCAGCPNQKACSTGEKIVDPDAELIRDRLGAVKNKVQFFLKISLQDFTPICNHLLF
jgi:hypothetical protein